MVLNGSPSSYHKNPATIYCIINALGLVKRDLPVLKCFEISSSILQFIIVEGKYFIFGMKENPTAGIFSLVTSFTFPPALQLYFNR